MNKQRLKEKIKSFLNKHHTVLLPDLLYEELVYVDRESEINKEDFERLLIMNRFLRESYTGENDIDGGYTEYERYFASVKKNYPDIWREMIEKEYGEHWKKIYNPSLSSKKQKQIGKIYLSIDKKDLANFAFELLSKIAFKPNQIDDYNFKINNGEQGNRTDNLVIYLYSPEDLDKYLEIIAAILRNSPQIIINESHLLGEEVQKGVVVVSGEDHGKVSFSYIICRQICKLVQNGVSLDYIADSVHQKLALSNNLHKH